MLDCSELSYPSPDIRKRTVLVVGVSMGGPPTLEVLKWLGEPRADLRVASFVRRLLITASQAKLMWGYEQQFAAVLRINVS